MSKHTASPWRTEFRRHAKLEEGSHVHALMDSEGYNIALISSWVNNSDTAAEAIANARLISAAPELLEACQAFSRLYGRLWDVTEPSGAGFLSPESVKEYDAIHQLMTVAIQKATA